MATQLTRRRRRVKHQWSSTEETRRSILDAARSVFGRYGFADANVAEIVEMAGSSVGSLYHHFGGKSELFVALWEQHRDAQQQQAADAVAAAAEAGETDPWELFLVSTRSFLDFSWEHRDLVRLFFDGDTPTGFGKELSDWRRATISSALKPFKTDDDAIDRVMVLTFTSVLGEAGREIARSRITADATALADNVMRVLTPLRDSLTAAV
ncbi:TetR/AcrR family transcriptional regulator [Desertimonas flava]|jgi:AcrR family transcriptional regulator|uniref:TetR/AcrR family transcriptional regulator n=1 Tax=Desertimonas flava TaxID=2064846 RepID=UPI000E349BAC|nr:TetR/AcrR family transcriptional regulator [Desertimonas flava]